jgi:hypothetical protein
MKIPVTKIRVSMPGVKTVTRDYLNWINCVFARGVIDMSRRTIENCRVVKRAIRQGKGEPGKEEFNGKIYCQGYQRSEDDDEPCTKCKTCHLNIWKYS